MPRPRDRILYQAENYYAEISDLFPVVDTKGVDTPFLIHETSTPIKSLQYEQMGRFHVTGIFLPSGAFASRPGFA